MWSKYKQITIMEALISPVLTIITCVIFNYISVASLTLDYETWSGQIINSTFYPTWVEQYLEPIYRTETYTTTDSKGNTTTHTRQVFSHFETRYRTHHEYWEAIDSLGQREYISKQEWEHICSKFGGFATETPHKSGYYSGDKHTYVAYNKTGYIFPTTKSVRFENRVKASTSLFSYVEVPKTVKVFDYPVNDWRQSNRLLGFAPNVIAIEEWDKLNSRLGPTKKVNLIAISFGPQADPKLSQYQEAKWIGGKKNDLVICFGGGNNVNKPTWCRVFGWTEQEIVKRNIESIILTNVINDDIIKHVESEVIKNYKIKDWSKFSYLEVEPETWMYFVLILIIVASQTGYYFWAFGNGLDKYELR
jgi:hypothetical protein